MGFLKNWAKQRKIRAEVDKARVKADLYKWKMTLHAQKEKKKSMEIAAATRHIEASEELKAVVSQYNEKNALIQILENDNVQILIKSVAAKLLGGGAVSVQDDELVTIYKKMPNDVKTKIKDFAMAYIGAK